MKGRYTPEQMKEALVQARGMTHIAAAALRCHERTVRRYLARYSEVRAARDEARGLFVDKAELRLMDAVDAGEWPAVKFTLVTLGAERGYVIGGDEQPAVEDGEGFEEFEAAVLKVYGKMHDADGQAMDGEGDGGDGWDEKGGES